MPKLIRVLLFVIAAQQSYAVGLAAQVWNYQFTPTGSRPVYITGEIQTPSNLGIRADLAGTFSIVIDWETNTGKLGHIDDYIVNTATVVSSPPSTILVPNDPSPTGHGAFATSLPYNELGTVTYSNGLGHLISNSSWFMSPIYDIWFTPTAATFSIHPIVFDADYSVSGAFAAFTSSAIAGDFNPDGRADKRDYIQWRNSGGSRADYSTWRFSFGSGASSAAGSAIPEPSSLLLLGLALAVIPVRRR
jgi:hypothetical protein